MADNETAWARRSLTVQDLVLAAFRRYPHRPCIVWEGGAATYSETAQRVGRMAMWLQSNIERTEHVGVALPNSREYLEAILALALAGRAYVAISPHDPVDAQLHKLRHADVKALFVEADAWEPLEKETEGIAPIHVGSAKRRPSYDSIVGRGSYHETKLTRPRPEEVFALGFSGGTSGLPKGVEKNHPQHIALMRNLLEDVFLPSEQTTFVAATPLTHAAFAFVIPTLLRGGSLSWLSRFDAGRIVDNSWLPNRPRIQTFLVPTALGDVADAASPSHSVDTIVYGGALCPEATLVKAVDRLGLCLTQVYGQAEVPMTICWLPKAEHADPAAIVGAVGYPFTFVDVQIHAPAPQTGVGEIVVRADHVMTGYWRNAEATAATIDPEGFLHTQDVGYFDDQGRVRVVGRLREMIITGGMNVFPDEVQRRLGPIPGVDQIVVFGVPDERWGEAVVAAVRLVDGASTGDALAAIESAARARLTRYERPKRVVLVNDIPLTSLGKVSRPALASAFTADSGATK